MKKPHDLLSHLVALENGINLDIGTFKKEKGDIFSECCTESFKEEFLQYVNEALLEMVKRALNDTQYKEYLMECARLKNWNFW